MQLCRVSDQLERDWGQSPDHLKQPDSAQCDSNVEGGGVGGKGEYGGKINGIT